MWIASTTCSMPRCSAMVSATPRVVSNVKATKYQAHSEVCVDRWAAIMAMIMPQMCAARLDKTCFITSMPHISHGLCGFSCNLCITMCAWDEKHTATMPTTSPFVHEA